MILRGNVTTFKLVQIKTQMMKKNFLMFALIPMLASSQVIIGKGKTTPTNSSVSLEFGTEPKGILLPWVESQNVVQNAVPGTLIFDASDKKVKLKTLLQWKDLSITNSGIVDTSLQDAYVEKIDAKVSIGTPTNTPGIFVLEQSDKAMILPLVTSYKDVKNPSAGMVVFDITTKQLCLFNGAVWSFWKG